jgi:uroporphyrinogen decarboxylase
MIEGGGSEDFALIQRLFRTDRAFLDVLLEKLTVALIDFFKLQIEAGVDAIQIFDSWGGLIAGPDYEPASLQWIRRIIAALPAGFPVILYAKGTAPHLAAQAASGARVLSVDWTVDLAAAHDALTQDPTLLSLLESMRDRPGHIFNLGHGIPPDAKPECVATLVNTVREWKN